MEDSKALRQLYELYNWLGHLNENQFKQILLKNEKLCQKLLDNDLHTSLSKARKDVQTVEFNTEKISNNAGNKETPMQPKKNTSSTEAKIQVTAQTLPTETNTTIKTQPETTIPSTETKTQKAVPLSTTQEKFTSPIPLPNAHKGKPYSKQLPSHTTKLTFQPECGLQWHENDKYISGTPNYTGDVKISYYLVMDNGVVVPKQQMIYINDDPKNLWKNIPTSEHIPFYKPDEQSESIQTPYGQLIAARVRGRSHAHLGKPCDDDYKIGFDPSTRLHFIAVSDGAGSAEFSRLGSKIAVNKAAEAVWEALKNQPNCSLQPNMDLNTAENVLKNLTGKAVYGALTALHQAAKDNQYEIKKLACTLLFVMSFPLSERWLTVHYSVGDGVIANWQPETQKLAFSSKSDSGSYSGETRFLSKEEIELNSLNQRTHVLINETTPTLLLMTDGVSDPKFETDVQLENPSRWANLWTELQPILQQTHPEQALQNWLNFWSEGNHDDRTLAIFIPNSLFRQPEENLTAPVDESEKVNS